MRNLIAYHHSSNGVMTISLTRVDKKNALTSAMYQELQSTLLNAETDETIKCIVIQGDETCFCAGNDLQDFIEVAKQGESLAALDFIKILPNLTKPLIAAVAGNAVGIGTTLLLHCDYVIAADNSKFKMPFTQLGLCPEAASSYLITRMLGHVKAYELLALGKAFDAHQALNYGVINQVCSPNDLLSLIQTQADQIAKLPRQALKTTKALIKAGQKQSVIDVMSSEAEEFVNLLNSADCQQILESFFKK